jgi:3-hydroxymyristoyl/3-hydroxydecanoyl-(acyl carrier protein) dehydratase
MEDYIPGSMETIDDIRNFIPQREPFVMVDKLLMNNDLLTRTSFFVAADNVFVEENELSEGGLLENIAQTAAAGTGYSALTDNKPVSIGYIGAVKNFEVLALPNVGDTLNTEIKIENQVFDVSVISGTVYVHEKLIASCEMKIFLKSEE